MFFSFVTLDYGLTYTNQIKGKSFSESSDKFILFISDLWIILRLNFETTHMRLYAASQMDTICKATGPDKIYFNINSLQFELCKKNKIYSYTCDNKSRIDPKNPSFT